MKISQKITVNKNIKGTHTILSPPLAETISTATAFVATAANAARGVSKNSCALYSKPAPKKITRKNKYKNWKVEPFKSALARAVEAKLKGLDPQLAAGEIVIPGGDSS